jgi:hypothetical protein
MSDRRKLILSSALIERALRAFVQGSLLGAPSRRRPKMARCFDRHEGRPSSSEFSFTPEANLKPEDDGLS